MTATKKTQVNAVRGDIYGWRDSFEIALMGAQYSDKTLEAYLGAVTQLTAFLRDHADEDGTPAPLPMNVADLRAEHISMFLVHESKRGMKSATVNNRYRSLHAFFLFVEGQTRELSEGKGRVKFVASPMRYMKCPKLDDPETPLITDDTFDTLLGTCKGSTFEALRDTAIFEMFWATPVRRSEMVSMLTTKTDGKRRLVTVWGKNDEERTIPFSMQAAKALDRYMRVRDTHPDADSDALWLGTQGPLQSDALRHILQRRCKQAGIKLKCHQFRHTFAHNWLVEGGQEQVLMMLTGWKSREMIDHYAKIAARTRAQKAYHDKDRARNTKRGHRRY